MKNHLPVCALLILSLPATSCNSAGEKKEAHAADTAIVTTDAQQQLSLPAPYATESATKFSKVIGWKEGELPTAPEGFKVTRFANKLDNPRWIYQAPNGDVFVAESNTETDGFKKVKAVVSGKSKSQNTGGSANRITIFRDADKDGMYEIRATYLSGLNRPLGMLVLNNSFYVANTDGLLQYPYNPEQTTLTAQPKKILELPAGGYNNHWTRNIIANAEGSKIYISVGSGSNVAEHGMENEVRRAAILEVNPDGQVREFMRPV